MIKINTRIENIILFLAFLFFLAIFFRDIYIDNNSNKSYEVKNEFCLVLNEKINFRTVKKYEYQGKIYNFCCATCIKIFQKNPDMYLNK